MDAVEKALARFMRERGTKRGFLLTPMGAYFLYEDKFCSIKDYQIRLKSKSCHLNTSHVEEPLFAGFSTFDKHLWIARPTQPLSMEKFRLVFHIACGAEPDELLRGICFADEGNTHFVLFSNPEIEALFLAAEAKWPDATSPVPPDEELSKLQQQYNRNDLHLLTRLYLQGAISKTLLDNPLVK